jgi:N-acetylmuramoyl-L-alanine amidase
LDNGITKYYVGLFRRFTDADDALRKVREYGYKDAYIVAFYNQKTINPERAKQLEK